MKSRTNLVLSILIGSLFLCTACGSDNDDLSVDDLPSQVVDDFDTRHANSTGVQWEREGNFYEAEFTENGVEKEIVYDLDGNWVQTECEISTDDIPEAAVAYINENYAGASIDEAETIMRAEGDFVEVEIDDNGTERELLFDEDGNFVEEVIEEDDDDEDDDD